MTPLAYILSGGISLRPSMPGWSFNLVRNMEKFFPGLERRSGMFACIVLERV
jgi:hypothetical protein